MYITFGNREELKLSLKNELTGAVITDLASATAIKFQINSGPAIISKTLGNGIEINTPATGDIKVTILPEDYSGVTTGNKYFAVQIEYSATDIREVLITENGRTIDTIKIKQDIIT